MIRLFELRTEKGLSQRELAKEMNISQGTYNNWENERTQPSIEQLKKLARLFNVSVDYLIGNTDEIGTVFISQKLSSEEEILLNKFRGISAESKSALLLVLGNLKQ